MDITTQILPTTMTDGETTVEARVAQVTCFVLLPTVPGEGEIEGDQHVYFFFPYVDLPAGWRDRTVRLTNANGTWPVVFDGKWFRVASPAKAA
jgi:hypothetical protein